MNVVSTMGSGNLGCEIDLESVVEAIVESTDAEIDVNYHGSSIVTIKLEESSPAITLYRTGSFQIRGSQDPDLLEDTKDEFLEVLSQIDVPLQCPTFIHQNTVFLEEVGDEINLELLALELGLTNVEYEPEQFPGLIFRPSEVDTVLLIFSTGKIIISGTTDIDEARESAEILQDILDN